jgi:uncharacterized protein YjiS (DUF1127 family)
MVWRRHEERHQPIALMPDAAPPDQRQLSLGASLRSPFDSLLLRTASTVMLKRTPATADFDAMNDHLSRDIGISHADIDSLVSHKDRWS